MVLTDPLDRLAEKDITNFMVDDLISALHVTPEEVKLLQTMTAGWMDARQWRVTVSFQHNLHEAETITNISSKILLFMQFSNMADSKRKSLSRLIAFSTRILTLATAHISIACCPVNFDAPLKKRGWSRMHYSIQ